MTVTNFARRVGLVGLACVLSVFLLAACATAAPTSPPPTVTATAQPNDPADFSPTQVPATPDPVFVKSLLGSWQGNNKSFYAFKKDGTWAWDDQQARPSAPTRQGTWWIEGTVLNLTDSAGGGQTPCPQNQVGTYQMDFRNGVLLLGTLKDRCKERTTRTQGMYHQLEQGK